MAGYKFGLLPKFLRVQAIHQYLYHLCHSSHGNKYSELPQTNLPTPSKPAETSCEGQQTDSGDGNTSGGEQRDTGEGKTDGKGQGTSGGEKSSGDAQGAGEDEGGSQAVTLGADTSSKKSTTFDEEQDKVCTPILYICQTSLPANLRNMKKKCFIWNGVVEFIQIKIKTNFSLREKNIFWWFSFPILQILQAYYYSCWHMMTDELPFSMTADQAEGVSGGQPAGREGAVRVRG